MSSKPVIRFSSSTKTARRIRESLSRDLKPIRKERVHLVNTYFDSPHHILYKAGFILRLTETKDKRILTLKVPAILVESTQGHTQLSIPFKEGEPKLDLFRDTAFGTAIKRWRRGIKLQPYFEVHCDRRIIELKPATSRIECAFDNGYIEANTRPEKKREALCEMRMKLVAGDPLELQDLALKLSEKYELQREHLTKADRGFQLTRPANRKGPVTSSEVGLDKALTVGEAFSHIVHESLDHLYKNEKPTLKSHPKGVHQTRVAIRRIRAALRAFKDCLPYDKRKAFNGEFRWFQQRFGPARDWHVFMSETLPQLKERSGGEPVYATLRKLAVKERRIATKETVRLMQTKRYARLLLQFEKWITALERTKTGYLNQPIAPFAYSVLHRAQQEVLMETRSLTRITGEQLHEIRKRGKKLRYAAEFFSEIWSEDASDLLLELKAFQDYLGQANDAKTAVQVLAALDPASVKSEDLSFVRAWAEDRMQECARGAQPIWRHLHRTQPFSF
jgi:inorganic triphosphatase YgiF